MKKRTYTQGQKVRIRYINSVYTAEITEIKVTVREDLSCSVLLTLENEKHMTLKVAPAELWLMQDEAKL